MDISTEIKNKRVAQGLTQEQLAEKIFVSSKTISNWETGRTTPDIDNLIRLKDTLNISLDSFLLEGSSLVENIKKKAQLKQTRTYGLLAYLALISFSFLNLFGHNKFNSNLNIILNTTFTIAGTIASLILMVSLLLNSQMLENELSFEEKIQDKKSKKFFNILLLSCAGLLSILVIISIIYSFSLH